MLRGVDPLLGPELIYALASMGHGDQIAVVDANFPAYSANPRCIRLDGSNATEVLQAVLSVFPLDCFVADPANVMQVVGDATAEPPIVKELQQIIDHSADKPAVIMAIERFEFYRRSKSAYAVVQTGELRLYGNILLSKGVVELP